MLNNSHLVFFLFRFSVSVLVYDNVINSGVLICFVHTFLHVVDNEKIVCLCSSIFNKILFQILFLSENVIS